MIDYVGIIKSKVQDIAQMEFDRGYKQGYSDCKHKINAAIKEIQGHSDRLTDSLYGDGMRHCMMIIYKYCGG